MKYEMLTLRPPKFLWKRPFGFFVATREICGIGHAGKQLWLARGRKVNSVFFKANFCGCVWFLLLFFLWWFQFGFFLFSTIFKGAHLFGSHKIRCFNPIGQKTPAHLTIKGRHQQGASIAAFWWVDLFYRYVRYVCKTWYCFLSISSVFVLQFSMLLYVIVLGTICLDIQWTCHCLYPQDPWEWFIYVHGSLIFRVHS